MQSGGRCGDRNRLDMVRCRIVVNNVRSSIFGLVGAKLQDRMFGPRGVGLLQISIAWRDEMFWTMRALLGESSSTPHSASQGTPGSTSLCISAKSSTTVLDQPLSVYVTLTSSGSCPLDGHSRQAMAKVQRCVRVAPSTHAFKLNEEIPAPVQSPR